MLNLLDEASIKDLVTEVVSRFGRIDALVNNSGYGRFGPLEATNLAELDFYVEPISASAKMLA